MTVAVLRFFLLVFVCDLGVMVQFLKDQKLCGAVLRMPNITYFFKFLIV